MSTAWAEEGLIPKLEDLSHENFEDRHEKLLNSGWAYFWGKLLQSEESIPDRADALVELPHSFRNFKPEQRSNPGFGVATYLKYLSGLEPRAGGYDIVLPPIATSVRACLFPKDHTSARQCVEAGRPGFSSADTIPTMRHLVLSFFPKDRSEVWVLELAVANYHNYAGGIRFGIPKLSKGGVGREIYEKSQLHEFFALGFLLAIMGYSLLIWLGRRIDRASLALAVLCFLTALRLLASSNLMLRYLPQDTCTFLIRYGIEYASLILCPLSYLWFVHSAFAAASYPAVFKAFVVLAFLYTVPLFFLGPETYTAFLPIYQIYVILSIIFGPVILFRAWRRNLEGIWPALIGAVVIIFSVLWDMLISRNILPPPFVIQFGMSFFMFLQGQVIALRSANAFRSAEQLSKHLDDVNKQLLEQERARTLFFHNTSHELRTPLNGMIGFLDLLRQGRYGSLPQKASEQIQKTLGLAESLKSQVNTILDLAKSKRGELKLIVQKFTLDSLKLEADRLAEGLVVRYPEIGYESVLNTEKSEFLGDPEKIQTILRNLLGNAFKFRAAGRPHHVRLVLERHENDLIIIVQDSGIGIPEAFQEKIFEEFGQVQADARRSFEGTGLGLSMVRDLVRLMHGKIELQSTVGVGSTFTITIPESDEASLSAIQPESFSSHEFNPSSDIHAAKSEGGAEAIGLTAEPLALDAHIMVIDDNETNCEVITEILRADGYNVRYAVSGRSGLEAMLQKRPDLLLLDMMMPEMSGEDVIRAMRAHSNLQEIPVILITARASEEDRVEGLKLGADDYLPKPIFAAELRLRVKNMIDRHRLLRELERSHGQEKLIQLGELIGDLSHELKNILSSASMLSPLSREDSRRLLSLSDFSDGLKQDLGYAVVADARVAGVRVKLERPAIADEDPLRLSKMQLWHNMFDIRIAEEEAVRLWQQLESLDEQRMSFVITLMKVFIQHRFLEEQMRRCQTLTASVLDYTRDGNNASFAQADQVWTQTKILIDVKTRRYLIHWRVELTGHPLAINPSQLVQVFLNLTLNAFDAVKALPQNDQWISLVSHAEGGMFMIEISNGGPPIPEAIQSNLFQRGFTSKGKEGSGIGLYLSRRILRDCAGDLRYDETRSNPCFLVSIPLKSQKLFLDS